MSTSSFIGQAAREMSLDMEQIPEYVTKPTVGFSDVYNTLKLASRRVGGVQLERTFLNRALNEVLGDVRLEGTIFENPYQIKRRLLAAGRLLENGNVPMSYTKLYEEAYFVNPIEHAVNDDGTLEGYAYKSPHQKHHFPELLRHKFVWGGYPSFAFVGKMSLDGLEGFFKEVEPDVFNDGIVKYLDKEIQTRVGNMSESSRKGMRILERVKALVNLF